MDSYRKANLLLMSNLTQEQLEMYVNDQEFYVVGSWSQRQYLIKYDSCLNVFDMDKICVLCAVLPNSNDERVPIPDLMLAQKLIIENNEKEFLRIAH